MGRALRVTDPPGRPPLALMLPFGFSSGLPLFLTNFTLQQWLSETHVSLRAIGATALIGLPYVLKFVWAPVFDRLRPPTIVGRLGRRRFALVLVQPLLALAILLLGLSDPPYDLGRLAALAIVVAFLSASQDILIDAWRIESYDRSRQGEALAFYVWGYRIAILVSQAGAIGLAGPLGWHGAYAAMAALAFCGLVPTLVAPTSPAAALDAPSRAPLRDLVVAPFAELLRRPGAPLLLALVLLFPLGTSLADTMAAPFYRSLGFDRAAIVVASSVPALLGGALGVGAGGLLVRRSGAARALLLGALVQMGSLALYLLLARTGAVRDVLIGKVVLEAFAEGMASAAFLAYLSALCSAAYTATQYALLSSLAPLSWRSLAGLSGVLAARLGWTGYFAVAMAASVPAILVLLVLVRRPAPPFPETA